jgi:hypothetical protein
MSATRPPKLPIVKVCKRFNFISKWRTTASCWRRVFYAPNSRGAEWREMASELDAEWREMASELDVST